MLKHISVKKLLPGSNTSKNESIRGATAEKLYQYVSQKKHEDNGHITDVIIHAGSNNLPKDDVVKLSNILASLLEITRKKYRNVSITFSPLIPKYDNRNIHTCDKINDLMRKYCINNGMIFLETRNLIINRDGLKFNRLSQYDLIHLNREGIVAFGKHLKYYLNTKNVAAQGNYYDELPPPPYTPPSSNLLSNPPPIPLFIFIEYIIRKLPLN